MRMIAVWWGGPSGNPFCKEHLNLWWLYPSGLVLRRSERWFASIVSLLPPVMWCEDLCQSPYCIGWHQTPWCITVWAHDRLYQVQYVQPLSYLAASYPLFCKNLANVKTCLKWPGQTFLFIACSSGGAPYHFHGNIIIIGSILTTDFLESSFHALAWV